MPTPEDGLICERHQLPAWWARGGPLPPSVQCEECVNAFFRWYGSTVVIRPPPEVPPPPDAPPPEWDIPDAPPVDESPPDWNGPPAPEQFDMGI